MGGCINTFKWLNCIYYLVLKKAKLCTVVSIFIIVGYKY